MSKYFSLKKYIVRILLLNIFGLAFLSDSISFDQGVFSLQGFFYSLNKFFYLVFILLETVSVYLQEYNLSFDFIRIILVDFFSLNFKYNFFILIEKYRYLLFFFLFIFYIFYFEEKIIKKRINLKFNLNFFIVSGILVFIIILLQNDRLELYLKKIKNYKDITLKYNFLRNDNWFLQSINYFDYEISTPAKTISSIAVIFAKKGLLTLDYETIDYSSSSMESYYYSFNQENSNINEFYSNNAC